MNGMQQKHGASSLHTAACTISQKQTKCKWFTLISSTFVLTTTTKKQQKKSIKHDLCESKMYK